MIALEARRVVVTRPTAQAAEICRLLEQAGAVPVLLPTIAIGPPADFEPLDTALRAAEGYDWWVFTSANGARSVLQRAATLGVDFRRAANQRLAAVGPATRAVLSDAGLRVAATPGNFDLAEITRWVRRYSVRN